MSSMASYIEKIDNNLNPILVKEITQIIRSKTFWLSLILILLAEGLFLSVSFISPPSNKTYGSDIMSLLFSTLMFVALGAIPLYHASRFSKERFDRLDELLYTTTITPQQIIRGKFLAGMVLVIFAYGLCSPFITLTFFLAGVDVFKTFVMLALSFCFAATTMMSFICIATIRVGGLARRVFQGIAIMIFLSQYVNTFGRFLSNSFQFNFASSEFIGGAIFLLGHLAILGFFMYGVAAAVISPNGSNKMYWIRTRGLVVLLTTFFLTQFTLGSLALGPWLIVVSIINGCMLFVAVSEPEVLSDRIKKEIPKENLKKHLVFPFFTGPLNGICWCGLVHFLSFAGYLVFSGETFTTKELIVGFNFFFSFVFYALLASLIVRTFLKGTLSTSKTWGVATILSICGSVATSFVMLALNNRISGLFMIFNPFTIYLDRVEDTVYVAPFIVILILFLNLRWFTSLYLGYKNAHKPTYKQTYKI